LEHNVEKKAGEVMPHTSRGRGTNPYHPYFRFTSPTANSEPATTTKPDDGVARRASSTAEQIVGAIRTAS
jgi:hypothetical protein